MASSVVFSVVMRASAERDAEVRSRPPRLHHRSYGRLKEMSGCGLWGLRRGSEGGDGKNFSKMVGGVSNEVERVAQSPLYSQ